MKSNSLKMLKNENYNREIKRTADKIIYGLKGDKLRWIKI